MRLRSALSMLLFALTFTAQATAQTVPSVPLLNPNLATEQELLAVPHLNATLARSVVAKRPYKTMLELNAQLSPALSKDQLTQLYGRLFLPLNLNSASREEILLIPGVGPRIAHEFEEYRPYKSMQQFRKEIGKYVDEKEVARLERYVTLE